MAVDLGTGPNIGLGDIAHHVQNFCPLMAVAKYPYKYANKADSEIISQGYFAAGLFHQRGWTLYYIYPPIEVSEKPLILVSAEEVKNFLEDINSDLGYQLDFPRRSTEPGFLLNLPSSEKPHPRYLGYCRSKDDLMGLENLIPDREQDEDAEFPFVADPEDRSFRAFKKTIQDGIQATKNKNKATKEKKKFQRIGVKQSWCRELKRVQCYLGVRPRRSEAARNGPPNDRNLSWDEHQKATEEYERACQNKPLAKVHPDHPVSYPFDKGVVFVCVDVESYERDHRIITEIGISSLDTDDIAKLPPGEGGKTWMSQIRARHFRIKEYAHLHNQDFLIGCADQFEKSFGTSEFVSIKEAPQIVAACFRPPFSKLDLPTAHREISTELRMTNGGQHEDTETQEYLDDTLHNNEANNSDTGKRKIVLVGHDTKTDIEYLRNLGYDVTTLSNLLEAIDTADLFRAWKHTQNPTSLGSVLVELGLVGWNLHNAGNDSVYTLQAMIGIVLQGLTAKIDRQTRAAEMSARLEYATKDAQERIVEESKEWELADNDLNYDGGEAIPVRKNYEETEKKRKAALQRERAEERKREKALDGIVEGKQIDADMGKRLDEIFLSDDGGEELPNSALDTKHNKPYDKGYYTEDLQVYTNGKETIWNDTHDPNRPYHAPKIRNFDQQNYVPEPLINLTDESESEGGVQLEQDRLKGSDLNARLAALSSWSVSKEPKSVETILNEAGSVKGETEEKDDETIGNDLASRAATMYDWTGWE